MRIAWLSIRVFAIFGLLSGCNPHGEAEDAVRRLMKDPEATEFKGIAKCSNDSSVTLGEYNAKNSFGAYTGFEPFYYAPDTGVVLLSDPNFGLMLNRCFGSNSSSEIEELDEVKPLASANPTRDADTEPSQQIARPETEKPLALCLGDYCPCDRTDPDYGGADVPLCRSLEIGVSVEDEMFAAAAAARDARRQLREFDNDYGEF